MPWRELSIMDQREEFVRLALVRGANRSELCRRFGISRDKGYKWLARYREEGRAGLGDRSRRPHSSPQRTAAAVEAELLRLRAESNNGSPWGDSGGERYTKFTVWLMRLGIGISHGRPYHPQTQGKDERFHRSLKAEVLNRKSFADLVQCQQAFDRWRPVYNRERPHEALGLAVPADRYRMSPRPYPEALPAIEYGPGDIVRKVDISSRISFKNRVWRIGKAFCGELIALRPTLQDGIFAVHYCAHRIGTIDLIGATPEAGEQHSVLSTSYPQAKQQQQECE